MHFLFYLYNTFGIFLFFQETHEKPSLLSINPGLIIWTIIIFVILVLLLKKIAWGPLIKALNNREDSIKSSIENAEKQNQEARAILDENKKQLAEASNEARKIVEISRTAGNKLRDDILAKANEDTKKMIEQAKLEIEQKEQSALDNMKEEISNLAIKAAEKIISESLDENKQKKIIDDFLKKIPKN
jgi:F-type H+-transporting ATPase subunit b